MKSFFFEPGELKLGYQYRNVPPSSILVFLVSIMLFSPIETSHARWPVKLIICKCKSSQKFEVKEEIIDVEKSYILVFCSWSATKTNTKCLRICILDTRACTQPIVLLANKDTFTNYTSCNSKTFNLQVLWPTAGVLTWCKIKSGPALICFAKINKQQNHKTDTWSQLVIFLGGKGARHQRTSTTPVTTIWL